MEFNLKNFPRFKGDIKQYLEEVIPWKIGFEKELRNVIHHLEDQQSKGKSMNMADLAEYHRIKEILGE